MPTIALDGLADADKSIVVGGVIVNSLFGTPPQVQPGQGLERSRARRGRGRHRRVSANRGPDRQAARRSTGQPSPKAGPRLDSSSPQGSMLPLSLRLPNVSSRSCTSTRRKSSFRRTPSATSRNVRCGRRNLSSMQRIRWGNGTPFPRAPLIDYAGIAAVEGEPAGVPRRQISSTRRRKSGFWICRAGRTRRAWMSPR